MIYFDSRRKKLSTLEKNYPGAIFLDVTSKGEIPWLKFSPFYPHGGIPIPFSPQDTATSVEGIWQGLKVFEKEDIDPRKFAITDMKGIKRSVRKNGQVLGHRMGIRGAHLLNYLDARQKIYLPSYLFTLEKYLSSELAQIQALAEKSPLVLLDYETNGDIYNLEKPLSHASLIVAYLQKQWPT